MFEPIKCRLWK